MNREPTLGTGDKIALLSLLVTIVALGVAAYTIRRSDLASSGATMVALNVEFRDRWKAYLDARQRRQQTGDESEIEYTFAELMNVVEIACGLSFNRTFSGISYALLQQYLLRCIGLIKGDQESKKIYDDLISRCADTYRYVERYEATYNRPHRTAYLDAMACGMFGLCLVLAALAVLARQ